MASNVQTEPFVPAWKRLGLQLKRPSEPARHQPPTKKLKGDDKSRIISAHGSTISKEGAQSVDRIEQRPIVARDKGPSHLPAQSTSQDVKKPITSHKDVSQQSTNARGADSPKTLQNDPKTSRKTAKGVTFSESSNSKTDTSAPKVNGSKYSNLADPESTQSLNSTSQDKAARKANKRAKREARKKSQSIPEPEANTSLPSLSSDSKPYLYYLHTFHTDVKNWKFNKALQIQLLNNAFDVHRIPPSYDLALHNYLLGLKGTGARARLVQRAEQILTEIASSQSEEGTQQSTTTDKIDMVGTKRKLDMDEEELVNEKRNEDERRIAMKRDLSIVKQASKTELAFHEGYGVVNTHKLTKRRRVEMILNALSQSSADEPPEPDPGVISEEIAKFIEEDPESESDTEKQNARKKRRPRRRKRRLLSGIPDDDFISSASSVTSSSSSESSSSEPSPEEESSNPEDQALSDSDEFSSDDSNEQD